jgi:hypothetical protein
MEKNFNQKLSLIILLLIVSLVRSQTLALDNAVPIMSITAGANHDNGRAVAYDSSGNYYVTGALNGRVDFDPITAGNQGPASVLNNGQAYLAKYNSSGSFQWYKLLSGGIGSYPGHIAVSSTGIYTTHLTDNGSSYRVVISKYDFAGNLSWSNTLATMTTFNNRLSSLKVDSSDNIYVAGTFVNTVDFNPAAAVNNLVGTGGSYGSGFIAKYNSSGVYQWAFAILGNTSANGSSYGGMSNFKLAISGNNLFVTGRFVGSNIDFDPSTGTNSLSMNSTTLAPIFIAKYDVTQVPSSTSFFKWVFQPTGAFTSLSTSNYYAPYTMPSDIDVDSQGNIFTVGQYILSSGSADFDPGSSQTPTMTTGGSMKVYVASFDGALNPTNNGFYRWGFTRDGSSSNIDFVTTLPANNTPLYNSGYIGSITCDAVTGDFYLGGSFRGVNIDMNPLCNSSPVLISGGQMDMYIARYSNSGICLWANSFASGSDGVSNAISSLAFGNGLLYATGLYKSTAGIDFDPSSSSTAITSFSTGSDAILLKYSIAPGTPVLDPIVQPTCVIATGTMTIANYNPSYTYTVFPSTGVSISGSVITAPPGSYTVTATLGWCLPSISTPIVSLTSLPVTLNEQVNTWNGLAWSGGLPPTISQKVVFDGDFSSTTDLYGCSCQVNSGNVVFNSNHKLIIENQVSVLGGSLTFENDASLVQYNDSAVNTGNIFYRRAVAALNGYDYIYWSSPVENQILSSLYVTPPPGFRYEWDPVAPNPNGSYGYWTSPPFPEMSAGKGYIMRASSSYGWSGSLVSEFVGVPHNGIFNVTLQRRPNDPDENSRWNLVGNPYPSSINAIDFLTENTDLDGYVALWKHSNAPSPGATQPYYQSFVYNYSNDYMLYNKLGTQTQDGFDGYIASGQGFFVNLLEGGTSTSTISFDNSMRNQTYANNQFFRQMQNQSQDLTNGRIWIDLVDSYNNPVRSLLGYDEGASMGKDRLYDASTSTQSSQNNIYTIIDNEAYAIQGRFPFTTNDEVFLGYNASIEGTYNIAIAAVDGIFDEQDIFLLDTSNNLIHDLKLSPYSFTTGAGEFKNRFKIIYMSSTLGTNDNEHVSDVKILSKDNSLLFESTGILISDIEIFDIQGKLLLSNNEIKASSFQTTLSIGSQPLVVKVILADQTFIVRTILYR